MPPHSRGSQRAEIEHPGAGTLFVHNSVQDKRKSLIGRSRSRSRTPVRLRPSSTSRERQGLTNEKWPLVWDDVKEKRQDPAVSSASEADILLQRGIGDYTFFPSPDGVLGKGKFSSVYKVSGPDGTFYALKHTPLHSHHSLIAARLLREPTLLAQLPPHPCLVGVEGWIRTEGHFYLIERYAASHIPLHLHPLPLKPSRAAYILDQLVSVLRDCMHRGRVCHRDLKGENVLVDVETGDIVVLDLGLATQFSASEPKLTTCCGSPAFHSPEIVNALNHPPGAVTYYGPELDIWCTALTLLSLLLSTRFPLGPSHRSRHTMSSRVLDRLQELDVLYPSEKPSKQWRLSAEEHEHERQEWVRVRGAMRGFLDMDGKRRMERFRQYKFGEVWRNRLKAWEYQVVTDGVGRAGYEGKVFKQLSFLPSPVKYTLPLSVLPSNSSSTALPDSLPQGGTEPLHTDAQGTGTDIILANPSHESDRRVLSYLKYLLRTHGILYHCTSANPSPLLQLVVPLTASDMPHSSSDNKVNSELKRNWSPFDIFRKTRPAPNGRSASTPPKASHGDMTVQDDTKLVKGSTTRYLKCYIQIEYQHPIQQNTVSRAGSRSVVGNGRSRTHTPRPRLDRHVSSTSTTSRGTSLAPTFVSRVRTRRDMSPPTATSPGSGGEQTESLAVASLQQALLQIESQKQGLTGSSGSDNERVDRSGWLSMPTSPRLALTDLPFTDPAPSNQAVDPRSPESTPSPSTPNTPTEHVPTPKPPPCRPPQPKRASSSPRLPTRGLPPVSPSLTLSPLPNMTPAFPLSPLSRQVSLNSSPAQEPGHSRAVSRQSSVRQPSYSSSRHPSRLPSRTPSRAASTSSTSISSPANQHFHPGSRITSFVSSPTSSDPGTRLSIGQVSSTSTISDLDSPSAQASVSDPISTVIIRLSDPRAYPALYKALNQPHIHPVPFSPESSRTRHKLLSEDITEAVGVPIVPSRGNTRKAGQEEAKEQEGEEEEERGRPRSRETPSSLSSGGGTRIGLGIGTTSNPATAAAAALTDKTISVSVHESRESPLLQTRELSAGRRLLEIVGLGQE